MMSGKVFGDESKKKVRLLEIGAGCFFIFIAITALTLLESSLVGDLNERVAEFFIAAHRPAMDGIMLALTNVANPSSVAAFSVLMMVAFLRRKRIKEILEIFVGVLGGAAGYYSIKLLLAIPRPGNSLIYADGFSYPSGHAAMSAIFFTLIYYLFKTNLASGLWKWVLGILCVIATVLISSSRLYLGVHRLNEIVAGWAFGLFWALFVIAISKMISDRKA